MLKDVTSAGALPALEVALRFSGGRQRVIAHNLANIATPNFVPVDVSVAGFQAELRDAIAERRDRTGGTHGMLRLDRTREVRQAPDGRLVLKPDTHSGGILGHDRNSVDLERTLQDMVENASMHRVAADLMRKQMQQLHTAISQRV